MNRLTMAVAVAALATAPVLTAPTARSGIGRQQHHPHAAFSARRSEGGGAGLSRNHGQHGLRPRLVLARRLARMGVLPMLTTYAKAAGAFAAMAVAATIGGFGSAAAQSNDYSSLPVDPNLLTDSLAYSAAPFDIDPNGQQGVMAEYTHREGGTRSITTTILIFPSAQEATASLAGAAAEVGNPKSTPAPVGTGGTTVSGTSPDGTESVTVLTFTEGNVATTIEFDGPPNDPAPPDFVTELGQKQDTAIRDWQGI